MKSADEMAFDMVYLFLFETSAIRFRLHHRLVGSCTKVTSRIRSSSCFAHQQPMGPDQAENMTWKMQLMSEFVTNHSHLGRRVVGGRERLKCRQNDDAGLRV